MRLLILPARMSVSVIIACIAIVSFTSSGQDAAPMSAAGAAQSEAAPRRDTGLQAPNLLRAAIAKVYAPQKTDDVGPVNYPSGMNALTGLAYPSEEARLRRNLIVKISNWPPKVRPQHGVNQADLVFEMESEGGVTRFAALFRSNAPEKVGSVRSARLVDMELLTMYAALLAYSGTSGPVRDIYKQRVNRYLLLSPSLGDNCEWAGFCRDESVIDRGYEHTMFTNTRQMWELADLRGVNLGFRAAGFAFDFQPDASDQLVNDIYINWFNRTDTRWQYDEASRQYLRYSDGLPHFDSADDTQLRADNLVFVQATHSRRPDLFERGAINESFEVALWGQGPALVMREGRLYQGYWRRRNYNRGTALALIYGDERPITLKPGRTWVTIMRSLHGVEANSVRADMQAAAAAAIARGETLAGT